MVLVTVVELGGGLQPHPQADFGIDLHHPLNTCAQDATGVPWVVDAWLWAEHKDRGPRSRRGHNTPIEDSSVDLVYASHFLEHIPAGKPRLDVFNEAWRILKPGGVFELLVPLVGFTLDAWNKVNRWYGDHQLVADPRVYADPTHVSNWWFPHSLLYFTGSGKPDEPMFADYGVKAFLPLDAHPEEHSRSQVEEGWVGHAWLVKP